MFDLEIALHFDPDHGLDQCHQVVTHSNSNSIALQKRTEFLSVDQYKGLAVEKFGHKKAFSHAPIKILKLLRACLLSRMID
jgi:hypothetical protein